MDENRRGYSLKAPGASGASVRLPGRPSFPRVDDHLVVPEITRDEIINGRAVVASPAKAPHARQQTRLDYVVEAHVVSGYIAAADLLTRQGKKSDFASDTCIYKDGIDPETGTRFLEEIAFEIAAEQSERDAREKAVQMHRRGVRRIFAVFVKGNKRVCEWDPETQSWRTLDADARIEDPCLVAPLSVGALLDAAAADNSVVKALDAKDNPEIRRLEATAKSEGEAIGEAKGEAKGKAEAILKVLQKRGIPVSEAHRQEIVGCHDLNRLDEWLDRAVEAPSIAEVMGAAEKPSLL
jgi:hypothetical protein